MSKKLVLYIVLLVIISFSSGVGYAGEAIKILVNGKEIKSDVPAQIIDGRTVVPLRFIAEALGAKVEWDADNNSVIINNPYNLLKVNGEQTTWPYWYENGNLYLEYRNAVELLKMGRSATRWNVSYTKENSLLVVNDTVVQVPYITKGDFRAISITYLSFNRNLIKFEFDPAAGSLTLLPNYQN